MSEEFRRQVKGQIIRAADLNKVSRSVSRLNRPLTPGGGLGSLDNTCGLGATQFDPDRPVWVQITGGVNPYDWQALIKVSGGWVLHSESPYGVVGDAYSASGFPLYEVNGGEGVHSGSIHRAWLAEEGDHLLFEACCSEIPLVITPPPTYSGEIFTVTDEEGKPIFGVVGNGIEVSPPVNGWPDPGVNVKLTEGYNSNAVEVGYFGQDPLFSINAGGTTSVKPALTTDNGIVIDLIQGYTATPFGIYDFNGNAIFTVNANGRIGSASVDSTSIVNGTITADKLDPSVLAGLSSGTPAVSVSKTLQATTADFNTPVLFDTEDFDDGGFHDNGTNPERLTVPAGLDGRYLFTANMGWQSGGGNLRYMVASKNPGGLEEVIQSISPTTDVLGRTSLATVYNLTSGNYVQLSVFQNAISGLAVSVAAKLVRIGNSSSGGTVSLTNAATLYSGFISSGVTVFSDINSGGMHGSVSVRRGGGSDSVTVVFTATDMHGDTDSPASVTLLNSGDKTGFSFDSTVANTIYPPYNLVQVDLLAASGSYAVYKSVIG